MIDSVKSWHLTYGDILLFLEWSFTILFSIEYILRVWIVQKPSKYIFSFYGLVDLMSILPSYIGLIITGSHALIVFRAIRLLRVFGILKLARCTTESNTLLDALKASRHKIAVFLMSVLGLAIIMGTLMYLIEGEKMGLQVFL